jgi:small subunit ribosomal protein S16
VAVRIRLLRMGKIRNPQYRIVIADSRTKRDGRAIEYVGIYHPKEDPSLIEVKSDRVQHWLSVGAQPSESVRAILSKTGDWQKFKGEPAPPPLLVKAERADRRAIYDAETKAAAGVIEPTTKSLKKTAEPKKKAEAAPEAAVDAPAAADAAATAAAAAPEAEATPAAAAQAEEQTGADAGPRA